MSQQEYQHRLFPEDINLKSEYFSDSRYSAATKKQIVSGHVCASKSEASLARALRFYCDYQIKEGETFQVPIGEGKTVDFLLDHEELGQLFIEWHPIVKAWEMDKTTFKEFKKMVVQYERPERLEINKLVDNILLDNYHKRRQEAVKRAPIEEYRDIPILTLTTPELLYRCVIVPRAAEDVELPKEKDFIKMFKKGFYE